MLVNVSVFMYQLGEGAARVVGCVGGVFEKDDFGWFSVFDLTCSLMT